MSVEPALLTGYLNHLRLTTFSRNYAQFAQDAAAANESYDQFLLALSREEVAHRDHIDDHGPQTAAHHHR